MEYRSIQEIIEADIDRKEFLQYLGVLLLFVTGVSGITKALSPTVRRDRGSGDNARGYGRSPYGY